jgi:small subunit ribosomal protein S20
MRTSTEARLRNRSLTTQMKNSIKQLRATGKRGDAENQLGEVFSLMDKAVKSNIIHKNKAARDKSKLAAFAKSLPE